ncbi:HPr family phosphocarrier protein [Mycoplasma iguanae]|uniref:Phosphocarrier protein HPr n=1 Tax=Mycoplasma iguanae TaxID=292461 RepID=A0ABY5R9X1_9MOLU|nr:HPr family phosphocarrier protein [Mycoplasma iguanae]UVD81579.1 HPr family phosphocarrier protein [Mycoplasma iguanae]
MAKFTATVVDPIGIHARPASKIVTVSSKFKSDIKIVVNEKTGNLKSIMNIMALGIKQGQKILVETEGEDADLALEEIKKTMLENQVIEIIE